MVLIGVVDGHVDLKLVAASEGLLLDDVGGPAYGASGIGCGGDDELVFGESFFGYEGTGKIELAGREVVDVPAEGAGIGDDIVDLFVREEVAKGGHDLREAESAATVHDDSFVRDIGFRSGLVAAGEVWPSIRADESSARIRCALSIGTVAGDASVVVDDLAVLGVRTAGVVEHLLCEQVVEISGDH